MANHRAISFPRIALGALLAFLMLGLGAEVARAAAPLRLGSVADTRFQTGWTLDGSQMAKTREKLLAGANFGAAGTVARPVAITDTAAAPGSIDATLLAGFDAFFIGFLDDADPNAFTAGELNALAAWVNGGGVLIVTCDDSGHDAVCAHFGYPATTSAVNPMVPAGEGIGHPIFNGPFGPVATFQMGGTQGFFTSTAGATVLAQDSAGSPHPVFLARKLGAGWLVLFADVNIVSGELTDGPGISNANDKVLGNLIAFAGNVAALRVGSVADARFGTGWTLDGSAMIRTRAKLLNPANFGASGTFGRAIRITDTAGAPGSIDATLLDQFDVFFIGFLDDVHANAFTLAELTALASWVAAGGTLLVTCDDADHDAVCAHLGHPSVEGAVNPMTPVGEGVTHPIFAGPFGGVPSFLMHGNQGRFTSTAGATVLAQDAGGQPVFLAQPLGAGWAILFADVDIIADALTPGDAITNDNDRVLGNLFAFAGAPGLRLFAAVLPISRSVEVGELATAYATILVTGLGLATDCRISPAAPVPGSGFAFQTTDPFTNQLVGALNAPALASGGGARTFLFALSPVAPFGPADLELQFKCANTAPAPVVAGLNTFLFLATAGPGPDMVALAATAGNTGIVDIPGSNGAGAFAVATINLGAGGDITVSADTGSAVLPLTLLLCRTDPVQGTCLSGIVPSLTVAVGSGETPTFAIFVIGGGDVPFDPALHRIFVRFKLGTVTVGATSVAVRTVPVP